MRASRALERARDEEEKGKEEKKGNEEMGTMGEGIEAEEEVENGGQGKEEEEEEVDIIEEEGQEAMAEEEEREEEEEEGQREEQEEEQAPSSFRRRAGRAASLSVPDPIDHEATHNRRGYSQNSNVATGPTGCTPRDGTRGRRGKNSTGADVPSKHSRSTPASIPQSGISGTGDGLSLIHI